MYYKRISWVCFSDCKLRNVADSRAVQDSTIKDVPMRSSSKSALLSYGQCHVLNLHACQSCLCYKAVNFVCIT